MDTKTNIAASTKTAVDIKRLMTLLINGHPIAPNFLTKTVQVQVTQDRIHWEGTKVEIMDRNPILALSRKR